jgi:WD40 repeat protein
MPVVFLLQLWDIREGSCKQTFPGHESDINAVTVSLQYNIKMGCEMYGSNLRVSVNGFLKNKGFFNELSMYCPIKLQYCGIN